MAIENVCSDEAVDRYLQFGRYCSLNLCRRNKDEVVEMLFEKIKGRGMHIE